MPGYVQWNIPLYDDDVLWVVPGSHRFPESEEQRSQLLLDPGVPLPGGVPVNLKAGDGVVYTNLIMHWGSYYSPRLRRTIHLGHRSFGGTIFLYVHSFHYDEELPLIRYLSRKAASQFADFVALFRKESDPWWHNGSFSRYPGMGTFYPWRKGSGRSSPREPACWPVVSVGKGR